MIEEQIDLFGFTQKTTSQEKSERLKKNHDSVPQNIAIIYTGTECGNFSGPKYFMKIDDAKKFCSDERSKGVLHGTKWAFFWTSLANYVGCYWDLSEHGIDFSHFFDNGSRDGLLAELGIEKLDPREVFGTLEKCGIHVITRLEKLKMQRE